jgi:F0F1-type ATP synthase membrane subunit b/b'
MDKTRVDDMLIEMITPKVREIEEKFSRGEGLSQDDINTLLLKSQYNHINHLDKKLDETVASVKELEYKFDRLENGVKNEIENFKNEVKNDIDNLRKDMENFKNEIRKDMDSFKKEIKAEIKTLNESLEANIQKALNKNMMMLIVVIGFFMTLSKLIDKF